MSGLLMLLLCMAYPYFDLVEMNAFNFSYHHGFILL